jgi:Fur family iron response transcriptional regulator
METKSLSREQVAESLRRHALNVTHQRLEIAFVLFSRMEHLSADDIFELVNAGGPQCSKATIYNTLKLFRESGLIRAVTIDPARVFYDPNTSPHHHLFDTRTGRLTDIPAGDIRVLGLPELPDGFVPEGLEIVVRTRSSV